MITLNKVYLAIARGICLGAGGEVEGGSVGFGLRASRARRETGDGSNDGGGNTCVRALINKAAVACSSDAKRHPRIATMPAPLPAVIGFCQSGQKILGATHDRPCRHGPWRADAGVYHSREVPWIGRTSRCTSGGLARLSSEPTHLTCTRGRGWGRRIRRPDQSCRRHRGIGELCNDARRRSSGC